MLGIVQNFVMLVQWKTIKCGFVITIPLLPLLHLPPLASGIGISEQETFQHAWLHHYLSTHPKLQGQEVNNTMMDKWIDGVYKGTYVCYCVIMLDYVW